MKKLSLLLIVILFLCSCSNSQSNEPIAPKAEESSLIGVWEFYDFETIWDEEALKEQYKDEAGISQQKSWLEMAIRTVFGNSLFAFKEGGRGLYTEVEYNSSYNVTFEYNFPFVYDEETRHLSVHYDENSEDDEYDYEIADGKLLLSFPFTEQCVEKMTYILVPHVEEEPIITPDLLKGTYIYLPDKELYSEEDYYDPVAAGFAGNYLMFDGQGRGTMTSIMIQGEGYYAHVPMDFSYDEASGQYNLDNGEGNPYYYESDGTRIAIWNNFTTKSYYEKVSDSTEYDTLIRALEVK